METGSTQPRSSIRLVDISKRFGDNLVLQNVSLELFGGEVHVIAGENGAGKSTLINILSGTVEATSGQILIDGRPVHFRGPGDAERAGIAVIHQELSLVAEMSVCDNLVLGAEPTSLGFGRRRQTRSDAKRLLDLVGLELNLDAVVQDLPLATRQLVEVAKALRSATRVLVMDEPTSALNAQDAQQLFSVVNRLKESGIAIVYISHKMDEIRQIAQRITVLRDGKWIGSWLAGDLSDDQLVTHIVGNRSHLSAQNSQTPADSGAVALRLENVHVLNGTVRIEGASLTVCAGEVVGLAGLQGCGATELLQVLFGASGKVVSGSVSVFGTEYRRFNSSHAIAQGIAYLPNDRKSSGLVISGSIVDNLSIVKLPKLSPGGWRRPRQERETADEIATRLRLKASSLDAPVASLSGGNQQKVALGKWLTTQPRILLLDEPTRGIDIGAKQEIYSLIGELRAEGVAILLITSELPELLLLSDRLLVMHRGHIVDEFSRENATAERVIQAAMNVEAA